MRIEPLLLEQQALSGFTHRATIDFTDLNTTASTTATVVLLASIAAKHFLNKAAWDVETAFVGAAITVLTMDFGVAGTTTAFVNAASVLTAGAGDGNGTAFATLRTGHVNSAAVNVQAVFTATGANLTALTAGKVHLYLALVPLTKLR